MTTWLKWCALLPLLAACNPEFDNRFSTVDSPRVLAIQSTPAQAAPSKDVAYRILVVGPRGTIDQPTVDWSFCTQAKPVSELNDVSQECFGTGEHVVPFAMGADATGTIPKNACRQFGPDIPETQPGEPAARPIDADSTGGYYQPIILNVAADGETVSTLGETRIACGLANSTGSQLEAYQLGSKPNENPKLSQVVATSSNDALLADGASSSSLTVKPGELVTLRASWPSCPSEPSCGDGMCTSGESQTDCPDDCSSTPVGCQGPEQYAYLDPVSTLVVPRHESMRVSWFATQGEFHDDHTGRLEEEFENTSSDNTWRAPKLAGPVFMWVVLRDARGGVDFQSYRLEVE